MNPARAAVEFANTILTTEDAAIGTTPRDAVWTHRKVTLYRYRSTERGHAVPVLLVFALINRPTIFDLRQGSSFVAYLLDEGFDVFLLDWGVPDDEDADMGIEAYVCDELPWGIRETLRAAEADEVSLLGWCIGGTLCAMCCALARDTTVRNLVLLTTPIDSTGSRYAQWVARDSFDADLVADAYPAIPGRMIDFANRLLKPKANFWDTYAKLWAQTREGKARRDAYQAMAKWVADNPPFPSRAYREWITWMYKENRLARGRMRLRGRRVDLGEIDQNLLVVTAGADHIAPPPGTAPIFDLVSSEDVTHFDRPGGHIGLMAGSRARQEIWPDLAGWLAERSSQ
jgi:polyhydroxyalkanoate synthase